MQSSRRAREVSQWSFLVLAVLAVIAFASWSTVVALVLTVAAVLALGVVVAQRRDRRLSRR